MLDEVLDAFASAFISILLEPNLFKEKLIFLSEPTGIRKFFIFYFKKRFLLKVTTFK